MKVIKTKEFILRHVRMSDAKGILECYKDKATRKNFMSSLNTLSEAKKSCRQKINEMKKKKPSEERWIIEVNGKFAGWITLSGLNKKFFEHRGNIGSCIHPKFRKRGLATKATKIIGDYAFKKYKLKRLEAMCRTFNKFSARVLEKAGFKLEGILRKNKCKNGKYLDDMIWARVR